MELSKTVFAVNVPAAGLEFSVDVAAAKTPIDYIIDYGLKQCLNDAVAGAKAACIRDDVKAAGDDVAKGELVWGARTPADKAALIKTKAGVLANARFKAYMDGTIRAGKKAKTLADIIRAELAKALGAMWTQLSADEQNAKVAHVEKGEGLKPGAQALRANCVILFNGTATVEDAGDLF